MIKFDTLLLPLLDDIIYKWPICLHVPVCPHVANDLIRINNL